MRVKQQRTPNLRKPNSEKPRRAPVAPEDKIFGMVLERLKKMLGIRYEDIVLWMQKNGHDVSVSTLSDYTGGTQPGRTNRIPLLVDYFNEVHGLDYVDERYFLRGTDLEKTKVEMQKEVDRKIKESVLTETPAPTPLEEYAELVSA